MSWISKKINEWCEYHYPLHTWNKVGHFFNRPKCVVSFGIWQGEGIGHCNPWYWWEYILDIQSWDVGWKDKTQCGDINISFEHTPQISILLFRYFHLWIQFIPISKEKYFLDETLYWETILTMTQYDKSLSESIELNTWYNDKTVKHEDGTEHQVKQYYDAYRCGMLTDLGVNVYVTEYLEKKEKEED